MGLFICHIRVLYRNGLTYSHCTCLLSGSSTILVFPHEVLRRNSYGVVFPLTGATNAGGGGISRSLRPLSRFISEMIQDSVTVTVERQ